VLYKNTDNI